MTRIGALAIMVTAATLVVVSLYENNAVNVLIGMTLGPIGLVILAGSLD